MISISKAVVAKTFGSLMVEAEKMGLRVNFPKLNYMTRPWAMPLGIEPGGEGKVNLAGDNVEISYMNGIR